MIPFTMNNTSTINDTSDSFGWLSELDPADEFIGMEKLEAPPFLIGNDSDFSSQDGSVHSLCGSDFAKVKSGGVTRQAKVSLSCGGARILHDNGRPSLLQRWA
jgi:hypothetical protein